MVLHEINWLYIWSLTNKSWREVLSKFFSQLPFKVSNENTELSTSVPVFQSGCNLWRICLKETCGDWYIPNMFLWHRNKAYGSNFNTIADPRIWVARIEIKKTIECHTIINSLPLILVILSSFLTNMWLFKAYILPST